MWLDGWGLKKWPYGKKFLVVNYELIMNLIFQKQKIRGWKFYLTPRFMKIGLLKWIFLCQGIFSWIGISEMGVKMNFTIIKKNHAANPTALELITPHFDLTYTLIIWLKVIRSWISSGLLNNANWPAKISFAGKI